MTASATQHPAQSHLPTERGILEGLDTPAAPSLPRPPRIAWRPKPPRLLLPLWRNRTARYSILAALLLISAATAFLLLRPVPQPDYALDPMDDVLNFTLLTDEFNALPVDKRLELLGDLIKRIRTMSADDSSLMAMFAASIDTDKLRRQMEENAYRLALDVWDKYALDYEQKPPDQRPEYLDQTLLSMEKMMETVAGVHDDKSDEQRLKDARQQAKRDQDALQSGKGPTGGQLARMADLMRNRVGSNSSPQQQQRGMQLMRDMTRNLRGQDPVTGKPLPPRGG